MALLLCSRFDSSGTIAHVRSVNPPRIIRPTECEFLTMLITNLEIVPNVRITKHIGLVQGSSVRSKHVGRDIMASLKNIFGGELQGYTELLQESRKEATERLIQQAESIGANAVLNIRYSTSSIAAGAAEIFVYGTAVQIESLIDPSSTPTIPTAA